MGKSIFFINYLLNEFYNDCVFFIFLYVAKIGKIKHVLLSLRHKSEALLIVIIIIIIIIIIIRKK